MKRATNGSWEYLLSWQSQSDAGFPEYSNGTEYFSVSMEAEVKALGTRNQFGVEEAVGRSTIGYETGGRWSFPIGLVDDVRSKEDFFFGKSVVKERGEREWSWHLIAFEGVMRIDMYNVVSMWYLCNSFLWKC